MVFAAEGLCCTPVARRDGAWTCFSKPDDNLAEASVGFHVSESIADCIECEDAIHRQCQRSAFQRRPKVIAYALENIPNLLDGPGAEGHADIADLPCGVQVEIEFPLRSAKPAYIDDAPFTLAARRF
nr:hypothetical protein [Xylophilus sp.]